MFAVISFLGFTLLVAVISYYKTRDEDLSHETGYFLAGRSLPWYVIAGSLFLTNISAEQLTGLNGNAFSKGASVMAWETVAAVAMIAFALIFLPRFLKGGITTVPQFLEDRFGKRMRLVASSIFLFAIVIGFLPFVLYAGSITLSTLFGTSETLTTWIMVVTLGVVGGIYAVFGGLKAVAVSDTVNGVGLLLGGFLVPVLALMHLGDGSMAAGFQILISESPERMQAASTSFGGWIRQQNGEAFPRDAHYSVFLADLAIRQLKASELQAPGKPVFSQIDFFDPHQPYSIPQGYEERYEYLRSVVQVPASFHELQDEGRGAQNPIFRLYHRYWGLYDEELVKDYIACHLLQVELVDYAIGKLFAYLKAEGLWDDSLILFTADHGEMNGRLGLADKGAYFHPDIFRVPMWLKPAGGSIGAPADIATPVSLVDLGPTILQAAGLETPLQMEGASLLDIMATGTRPALEQVYQLGIHVGTNFGFGCQARIGDTTWFYGYSTTTGCEELYDLGAAEPVNAIDDPALAGIRARMVRHAGSVMRADKRWSGYFASFRLHNMEHFMDESLDDIQMLKPQL